MCTLELYAVLIGSERNVVHELVERSSVARSIDELMYNNISFDDMVDMMIGWSMVRVLVLL
jgi:hypothetical protein